MRESETLNPRDLIKSAHDLVHAGNGKPRQSNLRRAVSSAYYAMFHTLAKCCADQLIGGVGAAKSQPAWKQVYRALDHGAARKACENDKKVPLFPREIQDFANLFVTMQAKRHKADYDPDEKVYKSAVLLDIDMVLAVIDGFDKCDAKDRRAFAAFVLFRAR